MYCWSPPIHVLSSKFPGLEYDLFLQHLSHHILCKGSLSVHGLPRGGIVIPYLLLPDFSVFVSVGKESQQLFLRIKVCTKSQRSLIPMPRIRAFPPSLSVSVSPWNSFCVPRDGCPIIWSSAQRCCHHWHDVVCISIILRIPNICE